EPAQLRRQARNVLAAPAHGLRRVIGQPVPVAVDAEEGGEFGMLVERPLELTVEESGELLVGRGLRRAGESGRGESGCESEVGTSPRVPSSSPTRFPPSASFCASLPQKAGTCGWSRYWRGVSTLARAPWKVASLPAAFAASRSFAPTASGVPAGTKS